MFRVLTRTREQSLRVEVGTIERGGRVCIIALQNTGSLRSTLTRRELQYLIYLGPQHMLHTY
jgi:hypothetical protein